MSASTKGVGGACCCCRTFLSTEDIGKVSSSCSIRFGSLTYVSFSLRADGPCSSTTAFSIRNSLAERGKMEADTKRHTRYQVPGMPATDRRGRADKQTDTYMKREPKERYRQTDRKRDRQDRYIQTTASETDRQDRQSDRHTERHTERGRQKRDRRETTSQRQTEQQQKKKKCVAYCC